MSYQAAPTVISVTADHVDAYHLGWLARQAKLSRECHVLASDPLQPVDKLRLSWQAGWDDADSALRQSSQRFWHLLAQVIVSMIGAIIGSILTSWLLGGWR